jgi:hypothetical protein
MFLVTLHCALFAQVVVLECHRAGVPDEVMNSEMRLLAYERLGWLGFAECPFVAPATAEGMATLTVSSLFSQRDDTACLPARVPLALTIYARRCVRPGGGHVPARA